MLDTFVTTGRVHLRLDPKVLGGRAIEIEFGGPAAKAPSTKGDWVAVRLLATALALASEGSQLRRCPDPKCALFFLRTGKQEFCSKRCARRVYMRARRREEAAVLAAYRKRRKRKGGRS
jgi:CGNR zinc finger protein